MVKIWVCIGQALPKQDAQLVIDLMEDLENVTDIPTFMQIMAERRQSAHIRAFADTWSGGRGQNRRGMC